jgi:hypothetical protein
MKKSKNNMEKKNLTITISGECASGKSRLTLLLKRFLRENGFEVDFDGGIDYQNESEFDEYTSKHFDQAIEYIKDNRKIILKEVQVQRDLDINKKTPKPTLGQFYDNSSLQACIQSEFDDFLGAFRPCKIENAVRFYEKYADHIATCNRCDEWLEFDWDMCRAYCWVSGTYFHSRFMSYVARFFKTTVKDMKSFKSEI